MPEDNMEFEVTEYDLAFEVNVTYDYSYFNTTEILNFTSNYNSSSSNHRQFSTIRRGGLSTSALIYNVLKIIHSVFVVLLNSALLSCLISNGLKKRRLGNHLYFVCNFSIADLLVGMEGLFQCTWYMIQPFTKDISILHHFIFKMLIAASLFLFVSHALLQWRAVANPLNTRVTSIHFMWTLTVASWSLAIAITGVGTWLKYRTRKNYSDEYIYFKWFELILYFVNSVAICIFYALVLVKIKKKRRATNTVMPDKNSITSTIKRSVTRKETPVVVSLSSNNNSVNLGGKQASSIQDDDMANGLRMNCGRTPYNPRKATLTSLTVAAVHIACSIPYIVFYLCYFRQDANDPSAMTLKLYINGLILTLRSLLLPIIFMRRTPEIYARLRRLWSTSSKKTTSEEPDPLKRAGSVSTTNGWMATRM